MPKTERFQKLFSDAGIVYPLLSASDNRRNLKHAYLQTLMGDTSMFIGID